MPDVYALKLKCVPVPPFGDAMPRADVAGLRAVYRTCGMDMFTGMCIDWRGQVHRHV